MSEQPAYLKFGTPVDESKPSYLKFGTPVGQSPGGLAPLEPEDDDDEPVTWAGRQTTKGKIREVAARMGRAPETVMRLGTWQGRLEDLIASTVPGQALLRTEQGLSDLAVAGLDLSERAGLTGRFFNLDREALQKEQRLREDFLGMVEEKGDVTAVLGETGSRIYSNATRNISKVAAAGAAGTLAVYSSIGAEVFDTSLNEAEQNGLTGQDSVVYAGKQAGIELGVMFAMGRVAESLGVRTLEESFSKSVLPSAYRLSNKLELGKYTGALVRGSAGAFSEGAEESITEVLQQLVDIGEGFRGDLDFAAVAEAGATGVLATAATHSAQQINKALKGNPKIIEDHVAGKADGSAEAVNMSPEELKESVELPDTEFKQKFKIPEDASQDYVDEFRGQLQDKVDDFRDVTDVANEVLGESTQNGIPVPENREDVTNLSSFVTDTTQPAAEPVGTEEVDTGRPTTVRHADLKRTAQLLGLNSYYSPGVRSRAIVQAEAKRLGIPEIALPLAREALNEGRVLRDFEQEGIRVKLVSLDQSISALNVKLNETADDSDIRILGAELNRQTEEAQVLHDAVALSRSEAGLALVHGKFGESYSSPTSLNARAKSAKQTNTTQAEQAEFTKLAGKYAEADAKVAQKTDEVKTKRALKILQEDTSPQGDDVTDLYKRVEDLFRGDCDI